MPFFPLDKALVCHQASHRGVFQAISGLQRKLLLAGFSEVEALQPKSVGLSNAIHSFGVS